MPVAVMEFPGEKRGTNKYFIGLIHSYSLKFTYNGLNSDGLVGCWFRRFFRGLPGRPVRHAGRSARTLVMDRPWPATSLAYVAARALHGGHITILMWECKFSSVFYARRGFSAAKSRSQR